MELIHAFRAPSFPCNPVPFANAISAGVLANGTNWITTDEAKAILYILISQSYGQLFNVNGIDEWDRLNKTVRPSSPLIATK
jgi:hypothetical protein